MQGELRHRPCSWSAEHRMQVTDFGLAKLAGQGTFLKTMCGTPSVRQRHSRRRLSSALAVPRARGHPPRGEKRVRLCLRCMVHRRIGRYRCGLLPAVLILLQVYAALANALPFEEDEKEDLHVRMAKRTPDLACVPRGGPIEHAELMQAPQDDWCLARGPRLCRPPYDLRPQGSHDLRCASSRVPWTG
jgi:hypothetical protein